MLVQIADLELPQLMESYERASSYREPETGQKRLTLVLTVPAYEFKDFRAHLTLHTDAFGPGNTSIFSRDYSSIGPAGAGKMIWTGAFGQKSAVRQSSLKAFQDVFSQMRRDIIAAFREPG